MSAIYRKYKLSEIAEVLRGISFGSSEGQDRPLENHLPVLRAGNIQDRLLIETDLVWVPKSRVNLYQLIKQHDIIMCTSSGSASLVGKCARAESDWQGSFGAFCAGIRPNKDKCDPSYLHHFLRSSAFTNWSTISSGANIKNIRKSELEEFEIPLPPLDEQRRIAAILDKADAIRRKRQESIRLTEEFLRSTFLEMFGDPVANPKGWILEPLANLVHFTTGKLDSNAAIPGGAYPFFTCAREDFQIDTYAFDCEALLLAGNNASADYSVKHYKGKFNAYQRTYVITLARPDLTYRYMQYALEMKLQDMKRLSKGTNTKYLTLGILNQLQFQVPDKALQIKFESIKGSVTRHMMKQNESLTLSNKSFESCVYRAFRGEL